MPGIVSIFGFERRVWYSRQPASCVICKKLGHSSKSCPLSGLCRRCRRPGHHCTNAWAPAADVAPLASAGNPPGRPPASAAVSAVSGVVCSLLSAPVVADVPAADPSGPVDAPAVQDAEMSDEDFAPTSSAESGDSVSLEEVAASGDDEVVATALSSSQSDSSRRRRKRRRRTVSPAVPCGLADMDTSVGEVPGHSLFKTFRGVWEDKFSWEEFPSRKPCYRGNTPPEPSPSPAVSPPLSFFASSATPVPPASPVPSSFL